jgi:hypothetical protein
LDYLRLLDGLNQIVKLLLNITQKVLFLLVYQGSLIRVLAWDPFTNAKREAPVPIAGRLSFCWMAWDPPLKIKRLPLLMGV